MEEPSGLFILIIHHPLRAFLIQTNLFHFTKKRFIQNLAIEISKFLNGLSQRFRNNLFPKNFSNPSVLRNRKDFYSRNSETA